MGIIPKLVVFFFWDVVEVGSGGRSLLVDRAVITIIIIIIIAVVVVVVVVVVFMPLDDAFERDLRHGSGHLLGISIIVHIFTGSVEAQNVVNGTWDRLRHGWRRGQSRSEV